MPVQTDMREELRQRLVRRPFVPFVIVMNNGQRHEIVRVAQAGIGRTVFGVAKATGSGPLREFAISDIASVTDITG